METITTVVITLIVFVLVIVLWIMYLDKRQKQKKQLKAMALGFAPEPSPTKLQNYIISLYQKRPLQKLQLSNVFVKQDDLRQIYLFDLWSTSDDLSLIVDGGIAIISSNLNLPRFSLSPKVHQEGKIAELANKIIHWIVEKDASVISFVDHPDFDKRYMVTGDNQEKITQFFTKDVLQQFQDGKYWQIEAKGNIFAFSRFMLQIPGQREQPDIHDNLRDSLKIFQLFVK